MSDYPKTGGSYRINEMGDFVRVTDETPQPAPAEPDPQPSDEPTTEAKKK